MPFKQCTCNAHIPEATKEIHTHSLQTPISCIRISVNTTDFGASKDVREQQLQAHWCKIHAGKLVFEIQ